MQKRGYYYCKAINTKNNTMEETNSHTVFVEMKPVQIDEDKIVLTRDNDIFTVTIIDFPEDMYFEMYARIEKDIAGSIDTKEINVPDAEKSC